MTWWENSTARFVVGRLLVAGRPAESWARRAGTPLFVYSRTRLIENYRRLRVLFDGAVDGDVRICYAMKANPFPPLLRTLRRRRRLDRRRLTGRSRSGAGSRISGRPHPLHRDQRKRGRFPPRPRPARHRPRRRRRRADGRHARRPRPRPQGSGAAGLGPLESRHRQRLQSQGHHRRRALLGRDAHQVRGRREPRPGRLRGRRRGRVRSRRPASASRLGLDGRRLSLRGPGRGPHDRHGRAGPSGRLSAGVPGLRGRFRPALRQGSKAVSRSAATRASSAAACAGPAWASGRSPSSPANTWSPTPGSSSCGSITSREATAICSPASTAGRSTRCRGRPSTAPAHEVINATRPAGRRAPVTVAGHLCETGDVFAKDAMMAVPEAGDMLAVLCAGAYGRSMASEFNLRPIAGETLA